MELYIQKVYYLYYCVLLAVSITSYFWFFFANEYKNSRINWGPLRLSWFVQSFIMVGIQIVMCDNLGGKVSRSYLRTYRWVRKNPKPKESELQIQNETEVMFMNPH